MITLRDIPVVCIECVCMDLDSPTTNFSMVMAPFSAANNSFQASASQVQKYRSYRDVMHLSAVAQLLSYSQSYVTSWLLHFVAGSAQL